MAAAQGNPFLLSDVFLALYMFANDFFFKLMKSLKVDFLTILITFGSELARVHVGVSTREDCAQRTANYYF